MRASEEYGVSGPLMPIAESDTVETEIRARAIRGPWFFAVGLSGIGMVVAGWFVVRTVWRQREEKQKRQWVESTLMRAEQVEKNQGKRNKSRVRSDEWNDKGKRDKQLKTRRMDRYRKKSRKVHRPRYVL